MFVVSRGLGRGGAEEVAETAAGQQPEPGWGAGDGGCHGAGRGRARRLERRCRWPGGLGLSPPAAAVERQAAGRRSPRVHEPGPGTDHGPAGGDGQELAPMVDPRPSRLLRRPGSPGRSPPRPPPHPGAAGPRPSPLRRRSRDRGRAERGQPGPANRRRRPRPPVAAAAVGRGGPGRRERPHAARLPQRVAAGAGGGAGRDRPVCPDPAGEPSGPAGGPAAPGAGRGKPGRHPAGGAAGHRRRAQRRVGGGLYERLQALPRRGGRGPGDQPPGALRAAGVERYAAQIHQAFIAGLPPKAIVVSFQAQHLWAYQNGQVVMDTPVTTGIRGVGDIGTDFGPMKVLFKSHPWTMHSPWPPGSPYWYPDTVVQWATFFTNTGESIHDAYWEPDSELGPGSQYNPSTRSHGCIHVPYADAQWIFNWAEVGMPVIVYPGDGTPVANQVAQITTDSQGNPKGIP